MPDLTVATERLETGGSTSKYEEVPLPGNFQSLSATTITSSPRKAMPPSPFKPSSAACSPMRRASPGRLSSPSILQRQNSKTFDRRIQFMNGDLPSLESVAPPEPPKPELVEEARQLAAAKALQRFSSDDDESSDDEGESGTFGIPKRKKPRTERTMRRPVSSREARRAREDTEHSHQSAPASAPVHESRVHEVLLAMASIANPSEKDTTSKPSKRKRDEDTMASAVSILTEVCSRSRSTSTEPVVAAPSSNTVPPLDEGSNSAGSKSENTCSQSQSPEVSALAGLRPSQLQADKGCDGYVAALALASGVP